MRCSTVSALFEVAALAAGALALSVGATVWDDAGLKSPTVRDAPTSVASASERPAVFEKDEVIPIPFFKRKTPLSR